MLEYIIVIAQRSVVAESAFATIDSHKMQEGERAK